MVQAKSDFDSYFDADSNHVTDCLEDMPQDKPVQTKYGIDPDHCEGKIDEYFICGICQEVVQDPQQCGQCDKLLCKDCIDNWLKRSSACVMCRSNFNAVRINRFVANQIEAILVKCSECHENVAYASWDKHRKDHATLRTKCILNCGSTKLYEGRAQMEDHFKSECPRIRGFCQFCKQRVQRAKMDDHDCAPGMRKACIQAWNQISALTEKIQSLSNENQSLSTKNQSLSDKNQQLCDKNHFLSSQITALQNKMTGQSSHASKVKMGTTGRYYCGQSRGDNCMWCDDQCGPTNGCQCKKCYELQGPSRDQLGRPFCLRHTQKVFEKCQPGAPCDWCRNK